MFNRMILPGFWHGIRPLFYGHEACKKNHSFGPAVRNCYLLHYVLEGEGIFIGEAGTEIVKKGDIFVIRPDEVNTYRTGEESPWEYVWLGFTSEQELLFLRQSVLRGMPVRHIFSALLDLNSGSSIDGRVYSLTFELLWTLSREMERLTDTGSRYAEYLKAYIDNSYMNRISIDAVARQLHVDRRYLTALFHERYGQPPQSYLMELRLSQADRFLQEGYSVTDAAVMAGFGDLSNFSSRYKVRYGIPPSRRRHA